VAFERLSGAIVAGDLRKLADGVDLSQTDVRDYPVKVLRKYCQVVYASL